jgi:hypothetical protein
VTVIIVSEFKVFYGNLHSEHECAHRDVAFCESFSEGFVSSGVGAADGAGGHPRGDVHDGEDSGEEEGHELEEYKRGEQRQVAPRVELEQAGVVEPHKEVRRAALPVAFHEGCGFSVGKVCRDMLAISSIAAVCESVESAITAVPDVLVPDSSRARFGSFHNNILLILASASSTFIRILHGLVATQRWAKGRLF